MRFFSSRFCYAHFRSRKLCGTFFILGLDFYLQDYISRLSLMGLKLHYATGSAPCFHPVNLSAVQDGVEVLLRIRDGLEVIGVYQRFDDRL